MRRAGFVGLLTLTLAFVASPVSAGPKIDLPKIVVTSIDGYAPAPPGMGLNGPVSKEQYIQLTGNTKRVRDALEGRSIRIYARTFARLDGGIAAFIGFQLDRPEAAKRFLSGVRERMKAEGIATTAVPGISGAIRSTQPATGTVPFPREQVFFRSGRVGFSVSVLATPGPTDPKTEVERLARVQRANVPDDVASEKDITETAVYTVLPVLLVILLIVVVLVLVARRRRGRATAEPEEPGEPAEPAVASAPPEEPPTEP